MVSSSGEAASGTLGSPRVGSVTTGRRSIGSPRTSSNRRQRQGPAGNLPADRDEESGPKLTPMDRTEHWDRIYERRSPREVSWYEQRPSISIRWVREAVAGGARSLLDVGGGASALVDDVLELGLHRIAVLDISERALQASRERLGTRADHVEWLVGDVTAVDDVGMFDIWHDRPLSTSLPMRSTRSATSRCVSGRSHLAAWRSLPRSPPTVRRCAAACRCSGTTRQDSPNAVARI